MNVRVRVVRAGRAVDLEVTFGSAATAGELAERLFGQAGRHGLVIDGIPIEPERRLGRTPVFDGSLIAPATREETERTRLPERPRGGWDLAGVAGVGAGGRGRLPFGDHALRADPIDGLVPTARADADAIALLSVSPDGVRVTVLPDVTLSVGGAVRTDVPTGSPTPAAGRRQPRRSRGRKPAGPAARGATSTIEVGPGAVFATPYAVSQLIQHSSAARGTADLPPADGRTRVTFHRRHRDAPPPASAPLRVPENPRDSAYTSPFNFAMLFAPLLFAGGIYATTRNVSYALISLLTVFIALGTFVESRIRRGRQQRAQGTDRRNALAAFERALGAAGQDEFHRRWALTPSPPDCCEWPARAAAKLWTRHPTDDDFLAAFAAVGRSWWRPQLDRAGAPPDDVGDILARTSTIDSVPLTVGLNQGAVVTVTGSRAYVLDTVRALVCQVVTAQGPAHVRLALLVDRSSIDDWDWAKWLPHLRDEVTGEIAVRMIDGPADLDEAVETLIDTIPAGRRAGGKRTDPTDPDEARRTLVIVDGAGLRPGSSRPLRRAIGRSAAALVVGGPPPDLTTTLIDVDPAGVTGRQTDLDTGESVRVLLTRVDAEAAADCARGLARLDDPLVELRQPPLPELVRLSALAAADMDLSSPVDALAAKIRRGWAANTDRTELPATIGMDETGPFALDIVRHGPHGLIGGTTNSGKSELLLTIVAALALRYDPDHVVFGLFDFKGKTSLQELEALPHCVGLVGETDLSEAERALRYLKAELTHREELLLRHDVQKIEQLKVPLPRLVVIIDEFQILADELPDLLGSIIDVTKRGRSLGVHLLFATQSPTSIRNYDEIKRNTRLRITLRVEDEEDSVRLIDIPDAALFRHPGRALARLGAGVVRPFQAGLVTGPIDPTREESLDLARFGLAGTQEVEDLQWLPDLDAFRSPRWWADFDHAPAEVAVSPAASPDAATHPATEPTEPTELSALIAGIILADQDRDRGRRPAIRKVWPDPLPTMLTFDDLAETVAHGPAPSPCAVVFARGDDPEGTEDAKQPPVSWDTARGNLLVYGVMGSGTSTTLTSLALAQASALGPHEFHLFALDFGGGHLHPLAELPHCAGNVLAADDPERHANLLAYLRSTMDARSRGGEAAGRTPDGTPPARILLLVDDLGAFLTHYEQQTRSRASRRLAEDFLAIFARGPAAGIHTAASVIGGRVPNEITSKVSQRLLLQLADLNTYVEMGLRRRVAPKPTPGRGVWTVGAATGDAGLEVQVAMPADGTEKAVQRLAGGNGWIAPGSAGPPSIPTLPEKIDGASLLSGPGPDMSPWRLLLGLAVSSQGLLEPVSIELAEGEALLVYGPARSGKSTLLSRLAELTRRRWTDTAAVYAVAPTASSPLRTCSFLDGVADDELSARHLVETIRGEQRPALLLVDDISDIGKSLNVLLTEKFPQLRMVVADRLDRLLSAEYETTTYKIARERPGWPRFALAPDVSAPDRVTNETFDYGASRPTRGRGFLKSGDGIRLVQT